MSDKLSGDEARRYIQEFIDELEGSAANVRFKRLVTICTRVFGEPRIKGSHHIFSTPWPNEPFVNIQEEGGEAKPKPYQVKQVVKALRMRIEMIDED